jgi:hypothetical protein
VKAQTLALAKLICLNGAAASGESLAYDTATGLIPPSLPSLLSQLDELEQKLGLPADPKLTPMQRSARLQAELEKRKLRPLSAQRGPGRPVRWTDSKGVKRVDLGAVFDNERWAA